VEPERPRDYDASMGPGLPASLRSDPRARLRNDRPVGAAGEVVVYWMERAQRAADNPALDAAIDAANEIGKPLVVFFGLAPWYPNANERHYTFLFDGLPELARGVEARGAAFAFRPFPEHRLLPFCEEVRAALVVGDENPLREPERRRRAAAERLPVALVTVDADVVVPSALFPREEAAARTLRPKIAAALPRFLAPSREPRVRATLPPGRRPASRPIEPARLLRELPIDRSAGPVRGERGGRAAGLRALRRFVGRALARYDEDRNRPELGAATSLLSPWLHFGQIGPREAALAARAADAPEAAKAAFLEQLVVRRELAVNFVARNEAYDRYEGVPAWARRSLEARLGDPRPRIYTEEELEGAATDDPLWNAAQREMAATGRMHGYVRMYWAKRLLTWTEHPARAHEIAVRLNDRYFLDGCDPNGYANIAWAIGGKHDRPWPPRPIFGNVRSMSLAALRRKLDIDGYIARVDAAIAGGA
jgi:deoxyribodipyrimidine photo-lyase